MALLPSRTIGVIGLGYVGLPVAVSLAERFSGTVGFDISPRRVQQLTAGIDVTHEVDAARLKRTSVRFTTDPG